MIRAKKVVWKGVFPAICCPLKDDYSVDEEAFRKYLKWLASIPGLGGLVVNGHASEVTTFSREERDQITKICVDAVGDKIPIICGVNCEGTLEATRHAKDAVASGASAVMIQPSHMWLRSGVSKETCVQYIRDFAESVPETDVAIQLYNKNCKAFYPIPALTEIAQIPNVRVMKLGIRDPATTEAAIRAVRKANPDLSLFTCYDESLISSMKMDVDGALVGVGGSIPELVVESWQAVCDNDRDHIRDCERRMAIVCDALYGIADISGEAHARSKELLHQRGGIPSGLARRPVLPLSQEEIDQIHQAMLEAKLPKIEL
jgi:4-hydroxy-tetrahydrodipicolinate synthase